MFAKLVSTVRLSTLRSPQPTHIMRKFLTCGFYMHGGVSFRCGQLAAATDEIVSICPDFSKDSEACKKNGVQSTTITKRTRSCT